MDSEIEVPSACWACGLPFLCTSAPFTPPNFNVEAPLFCQAWIIFSDPWPLSTLNLGGRGMPMLRYAARGFVWRERFAKHFNFTVHLPLWTS